MVIATKQKGSLERLTLDKYFNLIEHAADGIAIIQDGVFKLVNTALARISGYDKEKLLGMPFTNLLTPESQKLTVARYQARLAGKKVPPIYEVKAVTKDGEVRDIEINAALTEYEGRAADEVIVRDITERKRAEEETNRLLKTIETIKEAINITDTDGIMIYTNETMDELFGYKRGELIGKYISVLHAGPTPEVVTQNIMDAIEKEGFWEGEIYNKRKDSTEFVSYARISALKDKDGKITNFLSAQHDVTKRKRMEQQLQEKNEELDAQNEELKAINEELRATEEELQQSEGRLRAIAEALPDVAMVIDEDGRYMEVISGEDKLLYKDKKMGIGLLLHDVLPKDIADTRLEAIQRAIKTSQIQTVEYRVEGPDGERWFDARISPVPSIGKDKRIVVMISRDITERKQAEEALRESQKFSSSLLESSPNPISVINPDTSVRYVNPAFEKLTGFTLAEIAGRKAPYPWWPKGKRREITAGLKDAMAHGGRRSEKNFQKKNGEHFWVVVNSAPVVHEGKPVYFLLSWLDITERKQAEEALRESEKNLKTYLESAPDGVYLNDLKGTFLYGNKRAEEIIGYKKKELLGKSFLKLNLLPAKYLAKAGRLLALNAMGKPTGPEEFELIKKDGTRTWVEINTTPIKQEGKIVVIGFVRDITEHKRMDEQLQEKNEQLDAQNEELRAINEELRATEEQLQERNEQLDAQNEELKAINEELRATEEELQQSQEKLERMFESVTDGIVVANLDGTILKVNEKAVQMHGFASDDELLGKNAFELVAPGDHKRIANNMRRALKEGVIRGQEYTLLRADGSEFPGELNTSALKDASGNVIGHITIARDITERRQAEERERRLQQELDLTSRLASIGQMASGVAHEINNPLTGVIGFSHLMMSRDIPDDMKQDLQVINSEAKRVAKIVENLLTFARQRKLGREHVDINNIVARVLELRAYEMKVNNIEVETQLAPDLPYTMADAGQLQQVFLNIVLNAEHFMTTAHGRGKLLVKTERVDDNIRASFTDDGPGISKENLDKVFNPFFTTREVGTGTGLGLSICHGIITQHKGRIYTQSELGQGATFVVELPIVDDATQAGQAEVTKEEPQEPRGAKILVVDDEPAILTFLRRLLSEWGHSVETINNANAALDRLQSERYSLILLDIKLPGMSGVELYRHIEEIAPALTRRVMFITGDVMETDTQDFLDRTKVPHITKPLNIELLKKTINHSLNQTHVAATTPG